jgi:Na+/H+ antiporter NhaD/arsenite permease-like protein
MGTAEKDVFDCLLTLIFIFVAVVLLFPLNIFFPLDRRLGSLLGAMLCMLIVWAFPQTTQVNIGDTVDFSVLIILTAIMAINFVLLRQPWIRTMTSKVQTMIREDVNRGFFAVSLIALIASPFITNDGLCLMLVHPVLDGFVKPRKDKRTRIADTSANATIDDTNKFCPSDRLYFMLNIACSANIGSTLTFTGNPQNIIVAHYLGVYMNGGCFFLFMFIPALVSWYICINFLNYYRKQAADQYRSKRRNRNKRNSQNPPIEEDGSNCDVEEGNNIEMVVKSPLAKDYAQVPNEDEQSEVDEDSNIPTTTNSNAIPNEDMISATNTASADTSPANNESVVAAPLLVFGTILVLMLLEFIGVLPLAGLFAFTAVLLVSGVILYNYYHLVIYNWLYPTNSNSNNTDYVETHIDSIQHLTEALFNEIDYNLLIIFIGLFIVSGSFLLTNIPQTLWTMLAGSTAFTNVSSTITISIYIVLASQLIGNVPVVYMAVDSMIVLDQKTQVLGWLLVAFISTVAGNFTLVGSAANIIVVEKAMR